MVDNEIYKILTTTDSQMIQATGKNGKKEKMIKIIYIS
jgi:hypothetical protein